MKIALLYMDVSNLGDIVIYDNARYLLQRIIDNNNLDDCEIVPVDIGGYKYKFQEYTKAEISQDKKADKIMKKAYDKDFYHKYPWTAERMMIWAWTHSRQYKYFMETEMPKLKDCDLIIFGGGGLIKYHKQTFHFILDTVTEYAYKTDTPVLINSVGVEGYERKHPACRILKRAINRKCVKFISVRDDFELLRDSFIHNPNIEIMPVCDPAFWTEETYGIHRKDDKIREKKVGINAIRFAIFRQYMYEVDRNELDTMYRELVLKLHDNGYKVEFFSNGVKRDTGYIRKLIEKYPEIEPLVTVREPKTPAELVELLSGYERFLAVRLHASIIGTVLGIPNVSLVWNVKQILFGKLVHKPQNYLSKFDFIADRVYDRLINAEPYEMDLELKNTVYDSLERAILKNINNEHKPLPVILWYGARAARGSKRFLHYAKDFNVKAVKKIPKNIKKIGKRKRKSEYDALAEKIREEEHVVENRIAIMTNTSRYTCNPKYIYEELIRQDPGYDITWVVKGDSPTDEYPEGTKIVRHNTEEGLRAVYSAKIWLDNGVAFSNYYDKKENQIHLQTMHGSLGIKRIDNAVASRNARGEHGQKVVERESNNTNYVITNSSFEESVFRKAFWTNTPMIRLGHARTDILFSRDEEKISSIRKDLNKRYGVPEDKKILLYGPTHRKGVKAEDLELDYPLLLNELGEKFGGEFVALLRLHDRTKNMELESLNYDSVYDVSDYPDMQEIMLVSDVGITDYSSWIFDYVLMRRPGFLYAADIDRYNNRTGLAYPMEEAPFPVAYRLEKLHKRIKEFDMDKFKNDVERFLEEKESVDCGHSARDIVNWIQEIAPVTNR